MSSATLLLKQLSRDNLWFEELATAFILLYCRTNNGIYVCRMGDDFHFASHEMCKLAVQKNIFLYQVR